MPVDNKNLAAFDSGVLNWHISTSLSFSAYCCRLTRARRSSHRAARPGLDQGGPRHLARHAMAAGASLKSNTRGQMNQPAAYFDTRVSLAQHVI